jgi:putative transposase
MDNLSLKYHRQSIRLKNFDYADFGYYFVTICAEDKKLLFGEIINGEMKLNKLGEIIKQCWNEIPLHYPNVKLDEFVIMPNHIHGILIINTVGAQYLEPRQRAQNVVPLQNQYQNLVSGSLGAIIRGFKIGVTKLAKGNKYALPVWQRNYYEHVIRDENDLYNTRVYINENPRTWERDENNPNFI